MKHQKIYYTRLRVKKDLLVFDTSPFLKKERVCFRNSVHFRHLERTL